MGGSRSQGESAFPENPARYWLVQPLQAATTLRSRLLNPRACALNDREKQTHIWALHRRELEVFKIQSVSKSYFLEEEEPVLEINRT